MPDCSEFGARVDSVPFGDTENAVTRVGVILSGCGFLDGAEISESVLTMLHLDAAGVEIDCLAPDREQMHVIDHGAQKPMDGSRNVLIEASRIARGNIRDVALARVSELDALILPGGFGAAKNLSDFATAGAEAKVDADVETLIRSMVEAKKPIGAICISPAVVAAALRGTGTKPVLTIGDDADTAGALEAMGAVHQECEVTGFVVDEKHRIVSTPAYMFDAGIADVSTGIGKLVGAVLALAGVESGAVA